MKSLAIKDLKRRRRQLKNHLQNIESNILRGSLVQKYRKCGKSNCHCAKEQKHESHYLAVSMPAGAKPIMIYISVKSKNEIEQALANYQKAKKILEEISNINRELLIRKTPL